MDFREQGREEREGERNRGERRLAGPPPARTGGGRDPPAPRWVTGIRADALTTEQKTRVEVHISHAPGSWPRSTAAPGRPGSEQGLLGVGVGGAAVRMGTVRPGLPASLASPAASPAAAGAGLGEGGLPAITQLGLVHISSSWGAWMAAGEEQCEPGEGSAREGAGRWLGPGLHSISSPRGRPAKD